MMSEKKFKVGDRVRITSLCVKYEIEPIYGTVVSIEDYGIGVELDTPELLYLDVRDIEVVPPTDPRTAFLQELKELLSKYNVEIDGGCLGWDSEDPFVSFDSKDFKLAYCEEYCSKFKFPLTPDNIMDYEL